MYRVRGGSGLGDAIYLRPIVEHLQSKSKGTPVTVCCEYPEVFRGIECNVDSFRRNNVNVVAHYTMGKKNTNTNQWQDVCALAGVGNVALRTEWRVVNKALVDRVKNEASGRPVVLVHGGRVPMARRDGFGRELLPRKEAFDAVVDSLAGCFTVQIGQAAQIYPIKTDISLNGSTSVSDLLDLAHECDGAVGQCSFIIPLCEIFDKPLLCVWSHEGIVKGRHEYIRQITPKKVLSKPTSQAVIDSLPIEKIKESAIAFRHVL